MPTVPYDRTIRVVCHASGLGEESTNVWHVRANAEGILSIADATAIADAFNFFYTDDNVAPVGIGTLRPTWSVFDRISVYDLDSVPNPPPVEFTYAEAGLATPDDTPMDVAMCITLITAVGNRRGRGRIFLGPLANVINAATGTTPPEFSGTDRQVVRDAIQQLDLALQTNPVDRQYQLAVLSVADGVSRVLTSARIDARPDTQRRRDLNAPFSAATPVPL